MRRRRQEKMSAASLRRGGHWLSVFQVSGGNASDYCKLARLARLNTVSDPTLATEAAATDFWQQVRAKYAPSHLGYSHGVPSRQLQATHAQ